MHTNEPVTEVTWNEVLMSIIFEARRRMWLPQAGENEAETLLFTLSSLRRLRTAHDFVEKARHYPLPFINALFEFGLTDFDGGYVPTKDQVEFNRIAAEHGVQLKFEIQPEEPAIDLSGAVPGPEEVELQESRQTVRQMTNRLTVELGRLIRERGSPSVSAETFARRLFDLLG